jgi:radical SAM superfamily enzyme YgiQ (UPF0313 family)
MKLLLIYPSSKHCVKSLFIQTEGEGIGKKPPLGLLYIATYIKKYSSHQVTVLDLEARPLDDAAVVEHLREINPDVVGITCWTDFWYPVCRLIGLVKENFPDIHITLGGPHVCVFPGPTLVNKNVDSIILGDGEAPTLNLLNYLEFGEALLEKGIYLKTNPFPSQFQFYVENDLDRLPFPDRRLLPLDDYTSVLASDSKVGTMITSRGCPYRCVYCKLHFQNTICVSARNVVDEMEEIVRLGIREVEIYDDTFTWSKKRLIEICQGISDRGIKLKWAVRDRVNNVTEETLRLMKQAGCNRIHLGIESGNPIILRNIKKGITLEMARKAVAMAKKAGLKVLTYYMIGLPGETRKEVLETIDFAISLDSDYAEFNIAIPYPGTEMYLDGLNKGIIPIDYWHEYAKNPVPDYLLPFVYEENLTKDELIELRNLATKKYYFRPKVLFRELKGCSSLQEFMKKAKMGVTLLKHSLMN